MSTLALAVGHTYYRITYADRDFTMPGVEPMVYIGDVTLDTGESVHAFQDTVSFVLHGSGREPSATGCDDDVRVYLVPSREIGVDIVDLGRLPEVVGACVERATAAGWPVLPFLPDGWISAS